MSSSSSERSRVDVEPAPPGARAVSAWLTLFARTCKTCRLYDANNPAIARFREQLHQDLRTLLDQFDDVTLDVASRELSYGGEVVYRPPSRDDNLAATFHRDGIRRITLLKGIEAAELHKFVDIFVHVSSHAGMEEDLVTLLWEGEISGISWVEAPEDGDVNAAGDEEPGAASPMPWPGAASAAVRGAGARASGAQQSDDGSSRSDDHEVLSRPGDLEVAFGELESRAITEMARLQQEYEAESARPVVTRLLERLGDGLATETTPDDRRELASFIPRVLREALVAGDWAGTQGALGMQRACDPEWSARVFFEGLSGGPSLSFTRRAVTALDTQGPAGVEAFLALAGDCGEPAVDWLMLVLAESQEQRTRRPLARALATIVREHPERLLPWMSDDRWYVVRNVVHILGWIGGDAVASHLQAAIHHSDLRVRREVVTTLGTVSPGVARPILLNMLSTAQSRLFTTIVHQLSLGADPVVSQRLFEVLRDDRFVERPEDERRAVYVGIANQGAGVVGSLEEELNRGGLFARGLDDHRHSLARCLARIGTPEAREALQRGARSAKGGVRKACELALASLGSGDD